MAVMIINTTTSDLFVQGLTVNGPNSPNIGDGVHQAGATIDYGISFTLQEIYLNQEIERFIRGGSLAIILEGIQLTLEDSGEFLDLGSFFGSITTTDTTAPPSLPTRSTGFGTLLQGSLAALVGEDRLDASAIRNLSVALPDTENFLLGKNNIIENNEYFRVGSNVVTTEAYGGVIYQEEITITGMSWSRNPTDSFDGSVQLVIEGDTTAPLISVSGSQDAIVLSPPLTVSAGQRITAQWQSELGRSISTSLIFTFTRNP